MTYGSRYRVPLRRRREKKTDYQARKGFVVSGKPRLVARSSLNNTTAQIIAAKPEGDYVLASAHSRELIKKYGWKAATGNVPAAYLTGLLCGLKAKKAGINETILDLGLVSPVKGSKVFSTMIGVVDAGVEVPHSDKKIVRERIQGYHIQDYAEILGAQEEYAPQFSVVVKNGLTLEKFNEHFVEVRNKILTEYGMPIPEDAPRPAKPKPKKVEPKPVKAAPKPEAKKPAAAEAKPAPAPEEAKPKVAAEPTPKAEVAAKPKAEAPTPKPKVEEAEETPKAAAKPAKKPVTKKVSAKAEEAEPEESEAKSKPKKSEAGEKPAKKTGGKKA
jgi:large subunit ribosomal protein L18